MADLPSATVTIDDEASAFAGGTGYAVVMGCVENNDDITPRVFASTKSLISQHGYCPAVDYVAHHIEGTKKPVIFVGLPKATAGAVGRQNSTGVTGSCSISAAAGSNGVLEEVDAIVTVVADGTIGTDLITFTLSLDGGVTEKLVRLGTNNSYTIPYVGIVLSFGAGDLNAGDVYTFSSTAPMWDGGDLTTARTALGAQLKLARSFVIVGDMRDSDDADDVVDEVNAYETSNDRFVYARVNVRDHLPLATAAKVTKRAVGTLSLTFDNTADTVVRAAGSWIDDGLVVGDTVTFTKASAPNDGVTIKITTLTDSTITSTGATLTDEGPVGGYTVDGSPTFTFDAGADTITRTEGNWFSDGFRVGDSATVDGTASNDGTRAIITLTATVMTFASGLANESKRSDVVTISKGETMAAWVAAMDAEFADVDGEKRIDIGLGRLRKKSPITGWKFRRPVMWAASVREYAHDVQIPCWAKKDGPLSGWSNEDANGNVVEYDERTDGGALAARFTCARTYSNGPGGPFIALSLTRATEGSLLSRTHNMAVANVACSIAQAETENAIGQVLVLNDDGTGSAASLALIEERVNSSLQVGLLQQGAEGQRASKAVWRASKTDILNVPGATLNGVLELLLNGTLEKIQTRVRVQTAG